MDSGNSESFQSSSGGDEEFDTQSDGISALLNNPATVHVGPLSYHQLPPLLPPAPSNPKSSYMYEHPFANYFDPISRSPPPSPPSAQPLQNPIAALLNSDVVDWSKTLRSESTSTRINPLISSSPSLQSLLASQQNQVHHHGSAAASQPSLGEEDNTDTTRVLPLEPPPLVVRNTRKRPRASRRAPTTVLTTDTANFRAMVQEFTGIPSAPFASSPFYKSRPEFFGIASGLRSMETLNPPLYLQRPFPQKAQSPLLLPFSSTSMLGTTSIMDHVFTSSSANDNIIATSNLNALRSSLNNFQFSSRTPSLLNLPNPFVASFLEPNAVKFPSLNSPVLGAKSHQESVDFPSNEEFGGEVNTSAISGLPGPISSVQTTLRNNNQAAVSWGNGVSSSQVDDQSHVTRSAANGTFSFSS